MPGPCCVCSKVGPLSKGMCRTHYFRVRRTGSAGSAEIAHKNPGRRCAGSGCEKSARSNGLCSTHRARLRRNGDTEVVRKPKPMRGEANPMWVGDQPGYHAMHQRLARLRGKASEQTCPCGAPAQEWSYRGGCPTEMTSDCGPYSADPEMYDAMCIRCHRFRDGNPIAVRGRPAQ
jgi:hypothetical protein